VDSTAWAAIAAIASAVATGCLVLVAERQRRYARAVVFVDVHNGLIEPDVQQGRHILSRRQPLDPDEVRGWYDLHPEERDLANRALALFDAACYYADRGYIARADFQHLWADSIASLATQARLFIAMRLEDQPGHDLWPNLRRMIDEVERMRPHLVRQPNRPA
jgi:hypothetical protein